MPIGSFENWAVDEESLPLSEDPWFCFKTFLISPNILDEFSSCSFSCLWKIVIDFFEDAPYEGHFYHCL